MLATGAVAFGAGSSFGFNVTGDAAGSGYDQLVVTGTVDLGTNTPFNEAGSSFEPDGGEMLFVIVNDGADAVSGTFAGLESRATTIDINGFTYEISYTGDSATQRVHRRQRRRPPAPPPPTTPRSTPSPARSRPTRTSRSSSPPPTATRSASPTPTATTISLTLSVPSGAGTVALPADAALTDTDAGEPTPSRSAAR